MSWKSAVPLWGVLFAASCNELLDIDAPELRQTAPPDSGRASGGADGDTRSAVDGGQPPDGSACSELPGPQCLDCCKSGHPAGYAYYIYCLYPCACGPCFSLCDKSHCSAVPSNPDLSCIACTKQQDADGSSCLTGSCDCNTAAECFLFRRCLSGCAI